jgi:DNA polymerase-3 subunit epsilon
VQFSSAEHHGALYDAEISGKILLAIARKNEVDDLEGINSRLGTRMGQIRPDIWHGCALKTRSNGWGPKVSAKDVIVSADADKEHPLYGVGVTFTGTLASMSRSEAQQLVASYGGQPLDGVTKKTNFLVFGEQDATKLRPGATKSVKYEKAVSLKHAGANIEVISEGDFLNMIADGSDSGIR